MKQGNRTIFLGGSCDYKNYYNWREEYIENVSSLETFNPYVKNWTPDKMKEEDYHRENDEFVLFVISRPNSFSIAELVDMSNKRPEATIAMFDYDAVEDSGQKVKAFKSIAKMAEENGAKVFDNHNDCINYINTL